jgi:hypothetical protein
MQIQNLTLENQHLKKSYYDLGEKFKIEEDKNIQLINQIEKLNIGQEKSKIPSVEKHKEKNEYEILMKENHLLMREREIIAELFIWVEEKIMPKSKIIFLNKDQQIFISEIKNQIQESFKIYDENILTEFHKEFLCSICLALADSMICCEICDNMFCCECIQKIKQSNDRCPNCRKENIKLRELTRKEKNVINMIKIKCPKNCGVTFCYEMLNNHLKECANIASSYQCTVCQKILNAMNHDDEIIQKHLKICEKTCNFCLVNYPLIKYQHHQNVCTERIIFFLNKIKETIKNNQEDPDLNLLWKYLQKVYV